jgi:hypothetical protein
MATNQGTAVVTWDGVFAGVPQTTGTAVVSDPTITANALVEAYMVTDDSGSAQATVAGTTHTYLDHVYASSMMNLQGGLVNPGVGFSIWYTSLTPIEGSFLVNWVWSDGI